MSREAHRLRQLPQRQPPDATALEVMSIEVSRELGRRQGAPLLWPLQAWAYRELQTRGCLAAPVPVGGGKCVSGETEVYCAMRGRTRADASVERVVTSMAGGGALGPALATSAPSGVKSCVRVETGAGHVLTMSTDHPVFTGRGWVHAENLRDDDLIATARRYAEPVVPLDVPDEEVSLVAHLIAEGGLTRQPTYTNKDPEVIADFLTCLAACGGIVSRTSPAGRATTFHLKRTAGFVHRYGIDVKSTDKRIPAQFYLLTQRQAALCLNRLWSCDGHVPASLRTLEYTSASEGLARDVQFLLTRLGIRSSVTYKRAKCQTGVFDAWRVTVSGRANVLQFFATVGPPLNRRKRSAAMVERAARKRANTNVDVIPFGPDEFKQLADEWFGERPGRAALSRHLGITKGQRISRQKFAAWVKASSYAGSFAWLASSDIRWETLRSKTAAGSLPVYDLCVPDRGNFIGNGVVLHNTWILGIAPVAKGAKRTVILTKPSLVDQTARALEDLRRYYARVPPADAFCIVPYSQLSRGKGLDALRNFAPDLVLADEAHCLANLDSNRSRRAFRYLLDARPAFVPLSGTMMRRSVLDYMHLYDLALGELCPLPRNDLIDRWASALDPGTEPSSDDLRTVRHSFGLPAGAPVEQLREAHAQRMRLTPGIITTEGAEIGTGLELRAEARMPASPDLRAGLRRLYDHWDLPDGEQLVDMVEFARHAKTLSLGFWNHRSPVPGTDPAVLAEWTEARAAWNSAMRWRLANDLGHTDGYDAPGLLAERGAEGRLPGGLQRLWDRWAAVRETIEWHEEVKWTDPTAVVDVADRWARKLSPSQAGVVWYSSRAVGQALGLEGIPTFGQGSAIPTRADCERGIVAASIRVHGTGANLQHDFAHGFVLEPMSSSDGWEQLLGRMHRPGQPEDTVHFDVAQWTAALKGAMSTAWDNSRAFEQSMGARLKLTSYADLDGFSFSV